MSIFRIIWRFLLLLLHMGAGIWLSLKVKTDTRNRSLPDPAPIARWSARLLKIMGIELISHGNPPQTPGLIVANHISWLDIPAINALTGAAFLSKDSIRYWPVIGWFAIASGTVFIRRGKHEAQRVSAAIAERLQQNQVLAIFPEGTTSDGSEVKRFFPRLLGAAIDTQRPVIPVALRYIANGEPDRKVAYTKGRSFFLILFSILARKNSKVHVFFSAPISSSQCDRRSLADAARKAIQASVADS
jgi:1-acyl-sn-glycerol-3-phosphate acyltransferase